MGWRRPFGRVVDAEKQATNSPICVSKSKAVKVACLFENEKYEGYPAFYEVPKGNKEKLSTFQLYFFTF